MANSNTERDSLLDVERLRIQLEEQLSKLRKSLNYWQIVEADYEALKEELEALPADSSTKDIVDAGLSIESNYIDEKELHELTGTNSKSKTSKSPQQAVELVRKRIEYVHRNVESVQKQLVTAEEKLDSASNVSNLIPVHEDGLPVREIIEELNDDGQVISGKVTDPSATAPEAIQALKKAGLQDDDFKGTSLDAEESLPSGTLLKDENETSGVPPLSRRRSILKDTDEAASTEKPRKKSVAFAEDSKPAAEASEVKPKQGKPLNRPRQTYTELPPRRPSFKASRTISDLAKGSFASGEKVIELDENDKPVAMLNSGQPFLNAPMQPTHSFPTFNEPSADAATRRRLLEYSMQEMNHVVAELNLENGEDESEWETDSDENAEWAADSDDEDEDEDEHGLSRKSGISPEYRQQMMELQAKLEAGLVTNAGPNPQLEELANPPRDDINDASASNKQPEEKKNESEMLGFDPARPTTVLLDTVVERQPSQTAMAEQGASKPKRSRFKAARQQASAEPHSGVKRVDDASLASNVLERAPQPSAEPPAEPDDLDPVLLQRELQGNYYEHRNRLVQKQGGFRRSQPTTDEDGVAEEEGDEFDENGKKVSLFKRARLVGDPWARDRVV